jgi:hypothetical protein
MVQPQILQRKEGLVYSFNIPMESSNQRHGNEQTDRLATHGAGQQQPENQVCPSWGVVDYVHISSHNAWWFLHVCKMWAVSCSASPREHIGDDMIFMTLFRCWLSRLEVKTIIKSLFKTPQQQYSYNQLTRSGHNNIFRLRTGHNRLNQHLNRVMNHLCEADLVFWLLLSSTVRS